ncbi:unnamed protein product [Durusdinium trenchii]|uniref:Apple domain-containing protein n=1 Tax=Durusdinium trenchii TaxID=1381693 RepID=A0ABP0IWI0_9DINO
MKTMLRPAFAGLLVALVARAAKVHSEHLDIAPPTKAASFQRLPKEKCSGVPYTKKSDLFCDGWTGISLEECEQKCIKNEVAPNCPNKTCQAANFYPGSMKCHLFDFCTELEDDFAATGLVRRELLEDLMDEDDEDEPLTAVTGPVAELAIALPIVLINMSNYSGQITNHRPRYKTYTFGNISSDLEMLYDKVQGFYSVLHESMNGTDGLMYCPTRSVSNMMECLRLATCLIQRHAPQQVPMETYAILEDLVTRFESITWPVLKGALMNEEGTLDLIKKDQRLPPLYNCVATEEISEEDVSAPGGVFLQLHDESATSMALARATRGTHQILDSHTHNSSMTVTLQRLEELWQPLCQELKCDHTNYNDILTMSHKQTLKLMQTASASQVGVEIRQRIWLQHKIQHFVAKHGAEGGFEFLRAEGIQGASAEAFHGYAQSGRKSLLSLSQSFEFSEDEEGLRLFDREQYAAFLQEEQQAAHADDSARSGKGRRKQKRQEKREKRRMMAKKIFGCLGKASIWNAEGYSRTLGSYVGFSFGQGFGASNNALNDILKGQAPQWTAGYYSFYVSLGFGNIYKWFWGGLSVSGAFTITQDSVLVGVYVGAVACGWGKVSWVTERCPFGVKGNFAGFQCMRATGVTISLFCCGIDLVSGDNSCR